MTRSGISNAVHAVARHLHNPSDRGPDYSGGLSIVPVGTTVAQYTGTIQDTGAIENSAETGIFFVLICPQWCLYRHDYRNKVRRVTISSTRADRVLHEGERYG